MVFNDYDKAKEYDYRFSDKWYYDSPITNGRSLGNSNYWYPYFLPKTWEHNENKWKQWNELLNHIRTNMRTDETIMQISDLIISLSNSSEPYQDLWKALLKELKKKPTSKNLIIKQMNVSINVNTGFHGVIDGLLSELIEINPDDYMLTSSDNADINVNNDSHENHASEPDNDNIHYVSSDDVFMLLSYGAISNDNNLPFKTTDVMTLGELVAFYKNVSKTTVDYLVNRKKNGCGNDYYYDDEKIIIKTPAELDDYINETNMFTTVKNNGNNRCSGIVNRLMKAMSDSMKQSDAVLKPVLSDSNIRTRLLNVINDYQHYVKQVLTSKTLNGRNYAFLPIPALTASEINDLNANLAYDYKTYAYMNVDDYADKWADAISKDLDNKLFKKDQDYDSLDLFIIKYAPMIDVNILVILNNLILADSQTGGGCGVSYSKDYDDIMQWLRSRKTKRIEIMNEYIKLSLQGYPIEYIEQILKVRKQ